MQTIVNKICEMAPDDWDHDFMSLDDHIKDAAVRAYIFYQGIGSEVFPECCSGAEKILTNALYTDPIKFFDFYKTLVDHAGDEEPFISEAIDPQQAIKLKAAFNTGDALEVVKIFGDAAYGYCESAIRDACFDYAPTWSSELAESSYVDSEIKQRKERAA